MNKLFSYKGYTGSIDFSIEDECLFGKLLFINDLIVYEAETLKELEIKFILAVDDYLETCKKLERQPQKPFKGSLNIRIGEDLHRKAALRAARESLTLNDVIKMALEKYLTSEPVSNSHLEHHEHHHHHYHVEQIEFSNTIESRFTNILGGTQWKQSAPKLSKLN